MKGGNFSSGGQFGMLYMFAGDSGRLMKSNMMIASIPEIP